MRHPEKVSLLKRGPLIDLLDLILLCDFDIRIKSFEANEEAEMCDGIRDRRQALKHHIKKLRRADGSGS